MTHRRMPALLVTVIALTTVLSGCTGIPKSSVPQVIRSVPLDPTDLEPVITPAPGANARSIVDGFLLANANNDPHHNSARAFLTPQAKNRWSDTTVTVLDQPTVGNPDDNGKIVVHGNVLGTIDASGAYTPSLQGNGVNSGTPASPTFGMKRVNGQWRIDVLQNGLFISYAQFQQYQQEIVYFYDQAEQHVVPDPRYTDLTDPAALASWLLARLADGPRDVLQAAETTELPGTADPTRVRVTLGNQGHGGSTPTAVEIPGAAQLGVDNLERLATQVAVTLGQVSQIGSMMITDGGQPVEIPSAGGDQFTVASLIKAPPPIPSSRGLYYVDNDKVLDSAGKQLPGPVGSGSYKLTSVALADRGGTDGLLVAGVRGSSDQARLEVGTVADGLTATTVHGVLSRPDWAPDVNEIWIGDGSVLYRVSDRGVATVVTVNTASGPVSGRIAALRLSPDGTRVAMVLTDPNGTAQVWVGSVVRGTGAVRVVSLTPISPQGVVVSDVAWNDNLKLFTIGSAPHSSDSGLYEVECDGSLWTPRGFGTLPQVPDSLTVAEKVVAAVSAGGTVWKQQAGTWIPLGTTSNRGTNPVYVE